MCWSSEISSAFAAFDVASTLFLLRRNEPMDRLFAVAFAPIATQEILQVIIWESVNSNSMLVNVVASAAVRMTAGLIPLTWTYMAVNSEGPHGQTPAKKNMLLLVIVFTIAIEIFYFFSLVSNPLVSSVGQNHHMQWPNPWLYYGQWAQFLRTVATAGYVGLTFLSIICFVKPVLLAMSLTIPMALFFSILRIKYPMEWESIWCWTGTYTYAVAILRPYGFRIVQWLRFSKVRKE